MGGYTYNLTSAELGYDEEEELAAAPPPPAPEAAVAPPPAAPVENGGYTYNLTAEELGYEPSAPGGDPGYLGGYEPRVEKPVEEAPPPPEATRDIPPPPREGPGFFERLGTGLTELPGNAVDAIGGLFQSNDPTVGGTQARRNAEADAASAAAQRRQAEQAGERIDRDIQGPTEFLGEKIGQAATWAGDLIEDPSGSLEAAGTAIKDSGLGQYAAGIAEDPASIPESGGTWLGDVKDDPKGSAIAALEAIPEPFNRGLDYSKNIVNQDMANTLVRELTTGEGLDGTSVGNLYYLESPMRLHALNNPEDAQRMVDAYYRGYTREDGTYIEPGDRAMYIAYYEPLDTGQKMKNDAYTDPALIPLSVATMGMGAAANAVTKIPKVGRVLATALRYGVGGLDTAASLGTNVAVPGAIKGIGGAGKAVGLFKPSAASLDKLAVDEGVGAAREMLAGGQRAAAQEWVSPVDAGGMMDVADHASNNMDELPSTFYRTPEQVPVIPLRPGAGQRALETDVFMPDGTVMPAGSPRLEYAVGAQQRFSVQQGVNGRTWYVRENLPGAPKYMFAQPGTTDAARGVANKIVTDDPQTAALNFARQKTLEWQQRGGPDPVTFQWAPNNPRGGFVNSTDASRILTAQSRRVALAMEAAEAAGQDPWAAAERAAQRMPRIETTGKAAYADTLDKPFRPGSRVTVPKPIREYSRPRPAAPVKFQYPNKYEQRAQTVLADPTKEALGQQFMYDGAMREVGDVVDTFQQEIDTLRRSAQGIQVSRSPGEVRGLEKKWAGVTGEPVDWARMSDEQADDLAVHMLGQAIRSSRIEARGGPATDIFARTLGLVDGYMSYRRAIQLHGWAGGLSYIMMQGIGNAITGLIAKPAAVPYYFMNLKDMKRVMAWANDTATTDQLPSIIRKRRATGMMGSANINTTINTAYGIAGKEGGPFNHPGASAFKKNLGKVLAPRFVADRAEAADLALRLGVADATWTPLVTRLNKNLASTAEATRAAHGTWSTLPVRQEDIGNAIEALRRAKGDEFGAADLRDALLPLHPAGGRDAAQWANYVDRVSRDWVNEMKTIDKAVREEVNRVGFSFESTNADEVLSRLTMFHYWMSRASVLYLKEAAQNPWQLRAWMQGFEEADRNQRQTGAKDWKAAFVDFMKTPAGYTVSLDPTSLLGTYFFFAEQGGENPMGDYTTLGKFLDDGPGSNLMLNPLLQGAVYFLGAGGASFSPSDILGTRKFERRMTDALNLANDLGGGFIRSKGGEPVPIESIDSRKLLSWAAQYTSGRLPGTDRVNPFGEIEYINTQMAVGISERIIAGDPELKARLDSADPDIAQMAADQVEMATEEILLNPKHPYYQDTLDAVVESPYLGPLSDKGPLGRILGAAVREVSPFMISSSVTEMDEMTRRKKVAGLEETSKDRELKELIYDAPDERRMNLAFEKAGANGWTGDFGVEALIRQRNPSLSTDEVLMAAAKAKQDPDSPLMKEAQRLTDAEGVVKQITGGNWTQGTLTVNGQTISQEDLNRLDWGDRWKWANAWMDSQGLREEHEAFRKEKEAFSQSDPLFVAWGSMKELADSYPGGKDMWIADTMRINPGFRTVMENYERSSGALPGSEDYRAAAFKSGTMLAAEGAKTYGGDKGGNGKYAGLPDNQSLASWGIEQRQEKEASREGGGEAGKAILDDIGDVNTAYDIAAQYGEQDIFLQRLATGDTKTYYLTNSYGAIKSAVGYVPTGRDSDIEGYVVWLQSQPAGTFQTEEEAVAAYVQQKRAVEGVGEPLPQVSDTGAGTMAGQSLFDMWQRPTASPAPGDSPTPLADQAAGQVRGETVFLFDTDYAYFRPAPGRDNDPLAVVPMGQGFEMVEKVNVNGEVWARVRMPDGTEGYILAAYLSTGF